MIEEKQITRIRELRENNLTIKEVSQAVGVSESTVKKYSSDDYENTKKEGKTAKALTEKMIEEGYNFEDEIKPLVYGLKISANSIDITLYDYLNDINNIMNTFLKTTTRPSWFWYVFMELAKNFPVYIEHIEANDLMNAIDNFYNREIELEQAEAFILDIETKAERVVNNAKEECELFRAKTNEAQKEYAEITSLKSIMLSKMMSDPNKEKLKLSEESLEKMEKEMKELHITNQILIEKGKTLEQTNKNNEIIKQDNLMFTMMYDKLYKIFPQEIDMIIKEIENE